MGRRRLRKRANGEGSVYRRPDGRWVAEVTVGYDENGRQQKAGAYGRTQSEACGKLDELRSRITQGLPAKPQRQTVSQFLTTWLDTVCCPPNVSVKTNRTYRDLCEDHIIPALGRLELSKLAPQHVQQFVNDLLNKPKPRRKKEQPKGLQDEASAPPEPQCLSSRTVKHCRDVLRAALNVAMKWNLVTRNAAALATIPTTRKRKPQVFDRTRAGVFLEAINAERLEALFWLALCIGPREGELLGLQWTDFDFENGRVYLIRSLQRVKRPGQKRSHLELLPTKTQESERGLWLPQIVLEKVLAHRTRQEEERKLAGSAWHDTRMVFTTSIGTMLDARNMLRVYYRLRDRAQLPKIRFHDLRHSAATILKMAGIPPTRQSKSYSVMHRCAPLRTFTPT